MGGVGWVVAHKILVSAPGPFGIWALVVWGFGPGHDNFNILTLFHIQFFKEERWLSGTVGPDYGTGDTALLQPGCRALLEICGSHPSGCLLHNILCSLSNSRISCVAFEVVKRSQE